MENDNVVTVRRKSPEFEAFHYTGKNLNGLIEWMRGKERAEVVFHKDGTIMVDQHFSIKPGDWIVREMYMGYKIYGEKEFEKHFESVG